MGKWRGGTLGSWPLSPPVPTRLCSHKEEHHTCGCGHSTMQALSAFPSTHTNTQSGPLPAVASCHVCSFPGEEPWKKTHLDLRVGSGPWGGVFWSPGNPPPTHRTCRRWVGSSPATHSGHAFPERWALGARKPGPLSPGCRAGDSLAGDSKACCSY